MGLTIVLQNYIFSGEQNAASSYITLRLTYIRGLIHGTGRGVPNEGLPCVLSLTELWGLKCTQKR